MKKEMISGQAAMEFVKARYESTEKNPKGGRGQQITEAAYLKALQLPAETLFSQRDLARFLGVGHTTVQRWIDAGLAVESVDEVDLVEQVPVDQVEETKIQPAAPRVPRGIMRKSLLLLDMEYKPSELAEELGITEKTIYKTWLLAGLPFRKDATNHVWIVGIQARAWLENIVTQSAKKPKTALADGQGFCVKCHKAVTVVDPTRRAFGRAGVLKGTCPQCGQVVSSFIKASEL